MAFTFSSISGVMATSTVARFSFSWAMLVAPMMFEVTKGRDVTHASESCKPATGQLRRQRGIIFDGLSRARLLIALAPIEKRHARAQRGRAPWRYLPVRKPCASGE